MSSKAIRKRRVRAKKMAARMLRQTIASKLAFPLVRRIFPNLLTKELVSVQPMSIPTGSIFYLDYTYPNAEIQVMAIHKLKGE